MGLLSVGMGVTFSAAGAIANVIRYKRRIKGLVTTTQAYQDASAKAGVKLGQLLKIQEDGRATTRMQRNFRLGTQAVRSATLAVKEVRIGLKLFGIGVAKTGKKVKGATKSIRVIKTELTKVAPAAKAATSGVQGMFSVVAGGLASIAGIKMFSGLGDMLKSAIGLAGTAESTKVTFDALLGDQAKSADLMKRITTYSGGTPFLKSDIIEGSKLLLNVTKDNVDENERLFKMSANIAALKPGTKVADVSRGIFSAAMGDGSALKGFGIMLDANQFKSAGEVGGEKYAKAVTDEINRQFIEKTGGRDLVGALSGTLMGKVSTLVDNLENFGELIGETLIEAIDLKPMVDMVTNIIRDLTFAMNVIFGKEKVDKDNKERWLGLDTGIIAVAKFAKDALKTFKKVKKWLMVNIVKPAMDLFDKMGPKLKTILVTVGLAGASSVAGIGVVSVLFTTIGTVIGALATFAAPFAGIVIPAIKLAMAGLLGIMFPVVGAIYSVVFALMLWKKKGESFTDSVKRMGKGIQQMFWDVFAKAKAFAGPFIEEVLPQIKENLKNMYETIEELRIEMHAFFGLFANKSSMTNLQGFANMGWAIGKAFAFAMKGVSWFALGTVRKLIALMRFFKPFWRTTISDIHSLGKAFFDFVTGTDTSVKTLKTFMLALVDIVTTPFRLIMFKLTFLIEDTLNGMVKYIEPWLPKIAGKIKEFSAGMEGVRESINEGFLETKLEFKFDIQGPEQGMPIVLEMDGEKVADGLGKTNLRKKHSGRGGDPPNLQELGYMINSEGSVIERVSLEEAASKVV